ncbi:MAG: futalosine hydrolase [Desulfobulbaceae bacterium]|nr:futalosine hydrolase [Desulfobulbaceae bacterium]
MYLVTAATEYEMKPFLAACGSEGFSHLLTGVGPLETAVRLSSRLHGHGENVAAVINFGVAGAYAHTGSPGPGLLDICLAEREVMGDLGICLHDRIERLTGKELGVPDSFIMDHLMLREAGEVLRAERIAYYSGTFVTVNCASGTAERGAMLAMQHEGLCENMEGAAVARVCSAFALPCLEIRCISNMVEDRDTGRWQLQKACVRAARVTASVVRHLVGMRPELPAGTGT